MSGAIAFGLMTLAVAEWSLGYVVELGSANLAAKIFWAKVQYAGIVAVPVAWLVFALHFANREGWLTRRTATLAVVPVATLLLVWTNEWHSLVWSRTSLETTGLFPALSVSYGPWFWVHSVYSYMLLLLGTFFLVRIVAGFPSLYRWQAGLLVIGVLAPWVGNGLYIFRLAPIPNLDLTPFGFTISGVAIGWAYFRYGLLDVVPVARRAVVDSMSDAVIVLDSHSRIVDFNPAAQRLVENGDLLAIGRSAAQIFPDWAGLIENYRHSANVELEITRGKGEDRRVFDMHLSHLFDRRQRPSGRLIVLRDITGHKQTEAELRRQNEYLTALHQTTLALMHRLELAELLGTIVNWAAKLLDTRHGYVYLVSPDGNEIECKVGVGIFGRYVGTRLKVGEGLAGKVWQTGQPLVIDNYDAWPGRSPGFARRVIGSVIGVPLKSGPRVVGVIGIAYDSGSSRRFGDDKIELLSRFAQLASVAFDNAQLYTSAQQEIADRKRVEKALRESEAKFRTLAETVTGAIFILSGGRFLYANSAAEVMSGYSRTELLAMNIWDLVHPDYHDLVMQGIMAEPDSRRRPPRYELKFVNKAGKDRWVDLTTSLLEFEGAPAILATVFDITQRKRAENALSLAYEKALEASQLKTRLLANVSHDLRTPLNAILGYTEMLQEGVYGPLSQNQLAATREIIDSTGQLLNFVNNLLDQAQIESGQVVLKTVPFAPAELIEAVLSTFGVLARTKGLALTVNIDPNLPPLLDGDPYWIRQILNNLVSNAIKFTEKGTVHIHIGRPDDSHWTISVSDTGAGIPDHMQNQIFEAFQQEDTFSARGRGGSGLGLSIVKQLTALMGGNISVTSQVGQGSTFTVSLMLFPVEEPAK